MGANTANGYFYKPGAKERGYSEAFNAKLDAADAALAAAVSNSAKAVSLEGLFPVANYSGTVAGGGTSSYSSDGSRSFKCAPFYLLVASSFIVLEFTNWYSGAIPDVDGPANMTLRVGLEVGRTADNGIILPVKFQGADTIVIPPGGTVRTDPIYVDGQVGDKFWPRVTATMASGSSFVYQGVADPAFGYAFSPVQDNSRSGTNYAGGAVPAVAPVRILGKPSGLAPARVVGLVGDSIMVGAGATDQFRGGFAAALAAQGIPFVKIARGGETVNNFQSLAGSSRRLGFLAGCTHAIEQYGSNDFSGNNVTHAQVAGWRLGIWQRLVRMGMKVAATTILPRVTSTDSFATTTNQTPINTTFQAGGIREQHNAWLRDGAPMIGSTIQAAGTTGANVSRCPVYNSSGALVAPATGPTGHPLAWGVIEAADAVESSRNSAVWKVNGTANHYTNDGTHPTDNGYALIQAAVPSLP